MDTATQYNAKRAPKLSGLQKPKARRTASDSDNAPDTPSNNNNHQVTWSSWKIAKENDNVSDQHQQNGLFSNSKDKNNYCDMNGNTDVSLETDSNTLTLETVRKNLVNTLSQDSKKRAPRTVKLMKPPPKKISPISTTEDYESTLLSYIEKLTTDDFPLITAISFKAFMQRSGESLNITNKGLLNKCIECIKEAIRTKRYESSMIHTHLQSMVDLHMSGWTAPLSPDELQQSRDSGYDAGDDILWEKEEDFCKDMELCATAIHLESLAENQFQTSEENKVLALTEHLKNLDVKEEDESIVKEAVELLKETLMQKRDNEVILQLLLEKRADALKCLSPERIRSLYASTNGNQGTVSRTTTLASVESNTREITAQQSDDSFIQKAPVRFNRQLSNIPKQCMIRNPLGPGCSAEVVARVEESMPQGMHTPRGRRHMFHRYREAMGGSICPDQAPMDMNYSRAELMYLSTSPKSKQRPSEWTYLSKVHSNVCLEQVKAFYEPGQENTMDLDPRFVRQNSTFAERQRSEPITSGGFGTPNTRVGFQRSFSTNDSTYEKKSSYRDSQSSTGFKRSFSNENEHRSNFGSETFDSSNRRERNAYGYETDRFQQKSEEKQFRVGFGNKESCDMMGNNRRNSEEKDRFASGEPNFWPSGETGEDVGFHRQYSFPDSNAKISFRESMHSGGTSKPSTIVVFDRQNSCPATKTAGFGDRSSSAGGFGERSSNSGGFGDRSSSESGFGDRSSNVGGFGNQHSNAGGVGERPSNSGGFGDRSKNTESYHDNDSSNSIFREKSSNIGGFGFRDRNHNSMSSSKDQIRRSENGNVSESDWIEANDQSEGKTDKKLNDLTTCMDMAGIRQGSLDSEFDVTRTYLIPVKKTPAHLVVHGGFGLPPSSS